MKYPQFENRGAFFRDLQKDLLDIFSICEALGSENTADFQKLVQKNAARKLANFNQKLLALEEEVKQLPT